MNKPTNMLYFDIETASKYSSISKMREQDTTLYKILENKVENFESFYDENSSLIPIYGKITCLTLGYFVNNELFIKSFTGDEKDILENSYKGFVSGNRLQYMLCGYNILNFDIPWMNIKMMKYGIKIPHFLSTIDKKPWEMNVFDIYNELKMRKVSMIELCYELGINIPVHFGKEMDTYFWNNEIEKIKEHCESDVKATIELYKLLYDKKQK